MFISEKDCKYIYNSMMYQVEEIVKFAGGHIDDFEEEIFEENGGKESCQKKILQFLNFLSGKYARIAKVFKEQKAMELDIKEVDNILSILREELKELVSDCEIENGKPVLKKVGGEDNKFKIEEDDVLDNFNKVISILTFGSEK